LKKELKEKTTNRKDR